MSFFKLCFILFIGFQFLIADETPHYKIIVAWMDKSNDLDAKIVSDEQMQLNEYVQSSYDKQFEIITIPAMTKKFIFLVQDYSNIKDPTSKKLSNSQAMVFVYKEDELIKTYTTKSAAIGNEWIVFGVSENGILVDYNLYTEATNLCNINFEGVQTKITRLLQNQNRAIALNKKGEMAYRNYEYEEAIALYKKAIGFSPYNDEIFSNLGLVYSKSGLHDEAIWASQKAILYASSEKTMANAHYNLGRVYEIMNQNYEAMESYEMAWSLTKNISYQQAIKRVKVKIENDN